MHLLSNLHLKWELLATTRGFWLILNKVMAWPIRWGFAVEEKSTVIWRRQNGEGNADLRGWDERFHSSPRCSIHSAILTMIPWNVTFVQYKYYLSAWESWCVLLWFYDFIKLSSFAVFQICKKSEVYSFFYNCKDVDFGLQTWLNEHWWCWMFRKTQIRHNRSCWKSPQKHYQWLPTETGGRIAEIAGLSKEKAHYILIAILGMRKLSEKWMPHLLTPHKKKM